MLTVNLDKARHDLGNTAAGRTDYQVFVCLTEYMNTQGASAVPQNVISRETGYARRTVSNSIHRLAEKGFLTIEKDTTGYRGIPSNIYHINRKYLIETAASAKPECSACNKPCGSETDVRRLARLGEVLTDVIHKLLEAYEDKESK
ncbi:MAG: hypothetical protein IIT36_00430 [Aeriscardovia sp.]|nr:hypothetical protein [Aeriscardovia sp.]